MRSENPRGLSDAALRTLIDNVRCPMCLCELDDGWQCKHCGYDSAPVAMARFGLTPVVLSD